MDNVLPMYHNSASAPLSKKNIYDIIHIHCQMKQEQLLMSEIQNRIGINRRHSQNRSNIWGHFQCNVAAVDATLRNDGCMNILEFTATMNVSIRPPSIQF
jgi:hypothetical protein